MFRAFYRPATGKYREDFVDAEELDQLPAGAILVIKINNEDGTREIVQDEKKNRALTPKEDKFYGFALRQLEKKHDGGDTPEMRELLRENRGGR